MFVAGRMFGAGSLWNAGSRKALSAARRILGEGRQCLLQVDYKVKDGSVYFQ